MRHRRTLLLFLSVGVMTVSLGAQYAAAPTAYSVTETNSMFVSGQRLSVDRDGTKAVVQTDVPGQNGAAGMHIRTYYDLTTHHSVSWDPTAATPVCSDATFSGDWGDPFAMAAEALASVKGTSVAMQPADPVHGIAVTAMTMPGPGADAGMRAWFDTKYGLLMKVESPQHATVLEVTSFSATTPAATAMAVPPACRALLAKPPAPTESQRLATEAATTEDAVANAIMPPASANACTVQIKIARAVTLAPIAGVSVGLDLSQGPPANYTMGVGANGRATFSGGQMHDVTAQFANGVLTVPAAPPHFQIDVEFGAAGSSSALIYRQCFQPKTTLMLLVKNPSKLSDGADWVWLKK